MKRDSSTKHLVLFVFILGLLLASFALGCSPEVETPQEIELPAPAEATPKAPVAHSPTSDPITVLSAVAQTDFPKSLTFNLEVESSNDITGIELRYKIKKVTSASVTATAKPEFTPDHLVKTSWTWDTRKSSLPPGAGIEYRWVIENSAGNKLKTEWANVTFEDSRYEWQEFEEGNVRLLWYDGDRSFAGELMGAAQAGMDKLAADTGARLQKQVSIYVYAHSQELRGALVYSQEWTGGVAFTEYGIVAIGIAPSNLAWGKRTIAHELAHLVIHQVTYNPYSDLPTWLDEGMAMYAEGDLRKDLTKMLNEAIAKNTLFSVRSLGSSFSAETGEAGLAYAQSYSLVEFLIDNHGSEKMLNLLQVFKEGNNTDDALLQVYGFTSDDLDDLWRTSLGVGPRLVSGLGVS